METNGDLWVFIEQENRNLASVSIELLGGARPLADELGVKLVAILMGLGIKQAAKEVIAYGADEVYAADSPILEFYRSEAYSPILASLVSQYHPDILLLGSTSIGRDLAPRVAAKLKTGLTADCIKLALGEGGILRQIVPAFGGRVMAEVICPKTRPQMATVRPGVLKGLHLDSNRSGEVISVEVTLKEDELKSKILETKAESTEPTPLESANVVVAGGYGVGNPENWKLIEELANALSGSVGATRPPVDEGWVPEAQMIGQSGKSVSPNLYIGVGISGAMQHVVGVQGSRFIVVINNDQEAPFFEFADIGVVADLREFVPHLVREARQRWLGQN